MRFKKPTLAMIDFFKKRTVEHINRVRKYLALLSGFEGLDPEELKQRGLEHDKDKYSDPDLVVPYIWVTEYHRANNEEGSVPKELQEQYDLAREATGKHIKQNLHHPESHESEASMTNLDLAEMVADWSAMAEELGNESCRGWADENLDTKWNFNDEQKSYVYNLIDWLEAKTGVRKEAASDKDAVPVPEDYKEVVFYHGVSEEEVAKKILQDGFLRPGRRSDDPDTAEDESTIAPILDRVYVTTKLKYALPYVLGVHPELGYDLMYEYGGRYGYLFIIPGSALKDILPDEDILGELLADGYWAKELRTIVKSNLGEFLPINRRLAEEEWERMVEKGEAKEWTKTEYIKDGYNFFDMIKKRLYPEVAIAGKFFLKNLSDSSIESILEKMPAAISNEGLLRFSECWKLDKKKFEELTPNASNFFEVAERCPSTKTAASWGLRPSKSNPGYYRIAIPNQQAFDTLSGLFPEMEKAEWLQEQVDQGPTTDTIAIKGYKDGENRWAGWVYWEDEHGGLDALIKREFNPAQLVIELAPTRGREFWTVTKPISDRKTYRNIDPKAEIAWALRRYLDELVAGTATIAGTKKQSMIISWDDFYDSEWVLDPKNSSVKDVMCGGGGDRDEWLCGREFELILTKKVGVATMTVFVLMKLINPDLIHRSPRSFPRNYWEEYAPNLVVEDLEFKAGPSSNVTIHDLEEGDDPRFNWTWEDFKDPANKEAFEDFVIMDLTESDWYQELVSSGELDLF